MRRIQTQAEIDKKKKRNGFILGIVLIGLLILSTLGYSLSGNSDDSNKEKFGEYEFAKNGAYWVWEINGLQFAFKNLPQEVIDVPVSGFYDLDTYLQKPLYFVDTNPEARQEILNNLGNYIERWQEACLDGTECGGELPVKTCKDNLIIFSPAEETSIARQDNCVYIYGDSLRGADAFLYKLLGILP